MRKRIRIRVARPGNVPSGRIGVHANRSRRARDTRFEMGAGGQPYAGLIRMDFVANSHKISRMGTAQFAKVLAPIPEGQADGRNGSSA